MKRLLKLLFTKQADREVKAIHATSDKILKDTAYEAKQLRDLLKKNGITMQIYVATGGGKDGH